MKTLQLFYECWLEIAKQERYQDKWLSDETIFQKETTIEDLTISLLQRAQKREEMLVYRVEKSAPRVVSNEGGKKQERSALKDNLRAEIDLMRAAREMAINNHVKQVQEQEQHICLLQARINTLLRDFHKYTAIHNYAAELKVKETPSYIVILQAKLCHEIHRMCAEDNQLKLLRKDVKRLGTFSLKQLRDMEQERSDLEVQVVNGIVKFEAQQRVLQEEYNEKVHQQRLQVVDIQKKMSQDLGENLDSIISWTVSPFSTQA
jgi:hypothetical protein